MSVKFSNNGHSTLATSISTSDTSITVASGHGSRFPSLSSGEHFYATLIDSSNNLEIVKCTARSSDVLTVTRAQESTTARAYGIGDRIELRVTAQSLVDLRNQDASADINLNSNDLVDGAQFILDSTKIRIPGASSNISSPSAGDMYYNTTDNVVKHWNGSQWVQMSNTFSASGGTENTYTSGGVTYKSHIFTSSGTFVADASGQVDVIVVAGGGGGATSSGGGGAAGGGGGAGGCIVSTGVAVSPGANTVTIGGGGAGSTNNNTGAGTGANGGNSSALGISCTGGGGGGARDTFGQNGGSGGGTNHGDQVSGTANGTGISGQGNDGGDGGNIPSPSVGGGGGGKGSVGQTTGYNDTGVGGDGGSALSNDFETGSNKSYAGGGGGGGGFSTGGLGGGNVGADGANGISGSSTRAVSAPNNATVNRGGGGGGSAGNGNGSNGSSGVVIIRYAI